MHDTKLPNSVKCPVCGSSLIKSTKSYGCVNNHHFDQSRYGYVNLLLANQKRSNSPGDSKEMINARSNFLLKGYYQPIAQAISDYLQDSTIYSLVPNLTLLDIGCGIGYYIDFIKQNYPYPLELWGIDISKEAIKKAATMYPSSAQWLVSNMRNIPFLDESIECVLSVFAPLQALEISRILRKNGFLLTVTPAANHLIECRKQLFDRIKEIDNHKIESKLDKDFLLLKSSTICYKIQVEKDDINNLLKMTPYYWKSKAKQIELLQDLPKMMITIDVVLCMFQKRV